MGSMSYVVQNVVHVKMLYKFNQNGHYDLLQYYILKFCRINPGGIQFEALLSKLLI